MNGSTRTYVKLGIHASSFYSPGTKLKVMPGEVRELPVNYIRDGVIMEAISGGHLVIASEVEAKEFEKKLKEQQVKPITEEGSGVYEDNSKVSELESKLAETNKNLENAANEYEKLMAESRNQFKAIELLEAGKTNIFKFDEAGLDSYIKENYDLTKADTKAYDKMTFEEKQAYAYDLEKNSEEEAG